MVSLLYGNLFGESQLQNLLCTKYFRSCAEKGHDKFPSSFPCCVQRQPENFIISPQSFAKAQNRQFRLLGWETQAQQMIVGEEKIARGNAKNYQPSCLELATSFQIL
jgi:hypothetical protein